MEAVGGNKSGNDLVKWMVEDKGVRERKGR